MKKRILSIVLAVLMLLSVLPVTALAADNPTPSVVYEQGGVKIEKSAQWTDENKGEAEITFKISGGSQSSTEYPETDIVLVIDKSESMNGSRLAKAKKAAKSFVGKVFPELEDKAQIAVVSYDETATLVSKLTNDSNTLNSGIEKIWTNNKGTNIQAGIRLAQQTLTNGEGARSKAKKIMLVLTDGEPTYSYQFNVTGATWSGCYEAWRKCYGGSLENYGTLVESDVILGNGYNSYNNLNFKTNVKGTATCEHGNTHDFSGAYYTDGTFSASGLRSDTNHRAGTIWEANQAKAKGTEIYSIGFNIGSSGNAYDTMLSVATDANHFKTASDADLTAIFDGIADTITKAIINDAKLTDPLGNGFTLKEQVGGTTYEKTFAGQLKEQTVTFPIQYATSGKKSSNAPLPTNNGATLTYKDANGTEHTITLPNSPKLPNPSMKVSYDDGYNGAYATGTAYEDGYYWPTSAVSVAPPLTNGPAGYVFNGWYRGDEEATTFSMPEQDVELVAHWKKTKETKQLTITKSWAEDSKQAESVTIAVKNGSETVQNVTLDAANSWSATVNVPKYSYNDETDTATEINYTIEETGVNGTQSLNDVVNGITVGAWTPTYTDTTVTNTYTAKQTYGVTYVYTDADGLPEAVRDTLPKDDNRYYNEQPITPLKPTSETVEVNGMKYTFRGWTPTTATVNGGDVTFTGTWSFEALPQPGLSVTKTAKVNGEELLAGEKAKVGDTITYTITVTNTGNTTLTGVEVKDTFEAGAAGTLSFTGNGLPLNATLEPGQTISITATYVVVEADYGKTIKNTAVAKADDDTTGSAEVTTKVDPKPEPPQTEYKIELPISKELRLRSGSHPGAKTFLFDVSYKPDNGSYTFIDTIPITLADGDTYKRQTVTIEVSKEVYEAIWNQALVCVEERNLNENGFECDTTPRFGSAEILSINIDGGFVKILPNVPGGNATLMINPTDGSNFDFVNYYGKSGKVEKPVKVGPQLNRDDHVAYIMGYPDGRVRPEGEITRAEACTIFFRLLTEESRDYYFTKVNNYTDVARGDWFNNAISTLSNAGIVTGYNDGTFRPNQPITRGEMAKIIANFANLSKGGKSFTDLRGHWSKTYVELAAGNGWIAGYPDGSFRPDQKITRAETVTMINRVLERVPAKESRLLSRSIMLTFPDNKPGDWYYIAIQEASNSHEYQRSVYETTGDEMWTKLIDNVDWTKLEK